MLPLADLKSGTWDIGPLLGKSGRAAYTYARERVSTRTHEYTTTSAQNSSNLTNSLISMLARQDVMSSIRVNTECRRSSILVNTELCVASKYVSTRCRQSACRCYLAIRRGYHVILHLLRRRVVWAGRVGRVLLLGDAWGAVSRTF